LLFYTLAASLPLLLRILYLRELVSSEFGILSSVRLRGGLVFWLLLIAFAVKIPLYLVHL
jgi:NADH:ubiquinone oxidoreductase subunit 4 (subunit M)